VAVHTSQNTITYRFHDFAPNEIFPVTVILEPDALPIEKPDWQRVDEVQNYYGKYLLWLLAFTGVILLLLIFKLIADYKKKMNKYTPDDLPDDLYSLHPVYVSRLVNNFESSSVPFAVIFFLLLKMDAVKIIRRKTNKYEFELKEAEPAEPLEKRFYEVLQEKLAEGKNNLKKLFRQLDKYKKEFNQMIIEKLYELDLADEIMYQRNNRFLVYFLILLFALIIVFVAGLIRFSSGQVTVLFCTFPLAWLLFYFINAAGKIQIHTERGMELKCTWKLWKRLMIRQMKHKPQAVKPEEFDSVFPYTMVMGFSDKYIAFFKKTGVDLSDSELVRSFENVDEFVTFIGWYAAIASASGNSGAAGAAGGGAGGGSASAG
jgi:uncharacterized membrane protein